MIKSYFFAIFTELDRTVREHFVVEITNNILLVFDLRISIIAGNHFKQFVVRVLYANKVCDTLTVDAGNLYWVFTFFDKVILAVYLIISVFSLFFDFNFSFRRFANDVLGQALDKLFHECIEIAFRFNLSTLLCVHALFINKFAEYIFRVLDKILVYRYAVYVANVLELYAV